MLDATALIADDDRGIRDALSLVLEEMGFAILQAETAAEAIRLAEQHRPDIVLLDLRFPDATDLQPLSEIRRRSPETEVLLVTSEANDFSLVTEAVRLGAFDYVPKPVREDDLKIRMVRAMEVRRLRRDHQRAVSQLARGAEVDDIVGQSTAIRSLVEEIRRIAPYDLPVLIQGETGTGKELVARALHNGSPRRSRPFVAVNCAALPDALIESELFGHEKGAFTGAARPRAGAFEEAEDGTLFLDEIGDMNLQAQAALLRVLESGRFRTVGGRERTAGARVVLATNRDLTERVNECRFRQDLLFRVNRLRLRTPPLRERPEDIPLLANHFLRAMEAKTGKGVRSIDSPALEVLRQHEWPGNVRELRNEVQRGYIYAGGDAISAMDLSPELLIGPIREEVTPRMTEEIQKTLEALRVSGGNVTQAAKLLNVHRNTIRNRMKVFFMQSEG